MKIPPKNSSPLRLVPDINEISPLAPLTERPRNSRITVIEDESLRLLHELEVHQVELELQNEELLHLKEQAEQEAKKYIQLYNSSPSGYFTLSREGKILELNLAGAEMLGKNRSNLKKSKFGFFVSPATRPIFNLFIKNIFNSFVKETCVVILSLNGDKHFDVNLTGIANSTEDHCFVTMVDISERTRTLELLITNKELLSKTITG